MKYGRRLKSIAVETPRFLEFEDNGEMVSTLFDFDDEFEIVYCTKRFLKKRYKNPAENIVDLTYYICINMMNMYNHISNQNILNDLLVYDFIHKTILCTELLDLYLHDKLQYFGMDAVYDEMRSLSNNPKKCLRLIIEYYDDFIKLNYIFVQYISGKPLLY